MAQTKQAIPDEKEFENVPLKIKAENNLLRERKARFLINYRFTNNLPEIPCDPKMLLPPLHLQDLAQFQLTTLEKEIKRDMILPRDLGVPITAVNIDKFSILPNLPPLHPRDEALLEDLTDTQETVASRLPGVLTKRRPKEDSTINGDVTWLLRTKYITNETPAPAGTAAAAAGGSASTTGISASHQQEDAGVATEDVNKQIDTIEQTFIAARVPPIHPKNPSAVPLSILPILPDELLNGWNCVLATFDGDPIKDVARLSSVEEKKNVEMAVQLKSFVRRRNNGSADRFVALMLPERVPSPTVDESSPSSSSSYVLTSKDLTGNYEWIREYDSKVRYDDLGQTFLFRLAGNHVGYADLNTKVVLKKRKRGGVDDVYGGEEDAFLQPERFILRLADDEEAIVNNAAHDANHEDNIEQNIPVGADTDAPGTMTGKNDEKEQDDVMRDVFGSDSDDDAS